MNDRPTQLALRDLRQQLSHPVGVALMLGVAAVLAILGPFGTLDRLGLVQRLVYWLAMVVGTYGMGAIASATVRPTIFDRLGHWPGIGALGLITGAAIVPVVVAVNWITFTYLPKGDGWIELAGTVLMISVIVTAVLRTVETQLTSTAPETSSAAVTETAADAAPALLDRLPLEKRGALVALTVEDHYVRVRTRNGEDLILMRLGDAIRETTPTKGLQVHRSHWVALAEVTSARREGDRAVLTMSTGPEIPASRANVPALREAGLLPK